MEITITKDYLAVLFTLWICSVGSAVWGWPIWTTVSFMCFFLIYGGHEWAHFWICNVNNMQVDAVNLATGGKTDIDFSILSEDPDKDRKISDVYLAGVVWDSVFFAISILSSIFYGYLFGDMIPVTFGLSLILLLIFNLAMPGSDWQNYFKVIHKRA
jgi:hypothetical protein